MRMLLVDYSSAFDTIVSVVFGFYNKLSLPFIETCLASLLSPHNSVLHNNTCLVITMVGSS